MNYKKVRCDVCGAQRTLTGGHGMPTGWTRQVYIKCDQCQGKKVGSGMTSNPVYPTPTESWFPTPAPQPQDTYVAPEPPPPPPPPAPAPMVSGGGGDYSGGGASGEY